MLGAGRRKAILFCELQRKDHVRRQFPIEPIDRAVVSAELPSNLPQLVTTAGNAARFAYEEFFHGRVRNPYTRRNYRHAVHRFLDWCQNRALELHQIAP